MAKNQKELTSEEIEVLRKLGYRIGGSKTIGHIIQQEITEDKELRKIASNGSTRRNDEILLSIARGIRERTEVIEESLLKRIKEIDESNR